jgi:hypothetical protein
MKKVLFAILLLYSSLLFAHGSGHPERLRHYVSFKEDDLGYIYLSSDHYIITSESATLKFGNRIVDTKYILPSEMKKLMKILPEGFTYTGYLYFDDKYNTMYDNRKDLFTFNDENYKLVKYALVERRN